MVDGLSLSWVSDRHLRVAVGRDTSSETHQRVRAVYEALKQARVESLRDMTPAYGTVLLSFDVVTLDASQAEQAVRRALDGATQAGKTNSPRLVEIPVCYEGEYAPDIADVAKAHAMTQDQVAAMHSGAEYFVSFVGFVPGFAYLGGLPKQLETPRLDRPRVKVPAGSVGIAGAQTGVYPFATAGGWRLIGRTPLRVFDVLRERPGLVEMGDRVRFVRIGLEQFLAMGGA